MADSCQVWLNRLLSGQIDMQDAPAAIQSWSRLAIHEGALEILSIENKQERRAALAKIPDRIRPYVEAEAVRLWNA